jgi:Na+-driven multidrug efflux pump
MLYNFQLLKYAGENGVAAYGVIMYVNFIFISVYIGYAIGSAPIVGYNYGAGNHAELKNVYGKSIRFNILAGITMFLSAIALAGVLAKIFVGYDFELFEMTKRGFMIYSISFVIIGLNIWGSAFFTALGNGLISALISFLRTLLFQLVAVLVLPLLFELDGIWMAIVVAESVALLVSVLFLRINRKKYHY